MDFKQLREQYDYFIDNLDKLWEERDNEIKKINAKCYEKEKEIKEFISYKIQEYFDSICIDINGNVIKIDSYLSDGQNKYKVIDRKVTVFLGAIIDNFKVIVSPLKDNLEPESKTIKLSISSLTNFKIIDIEQQRNHLKD